MANDAVGMQLSIPMLRQPKMVWPGLDKEGLHLKSIAGDGEQQRPLTSLLKEI